MRAILRGFLLLCFMVSTAYATSMSNLGVIKSRLRDYYKSGAYERDLEREVMGAKRYLKNRVKANAKLQHPKKLAIVFDIDETALSNFAEMDKLDFGGTHEQEMRLFKDGKDPVIAPTLDLFNYAKSNNVAVFFVTGRHERDRAVTIKNLHAAGYSGWDGLILEPNAYHKGSAIPFKSATRQHIEEKGYDIVLSMGDQASDLKGGYADSTFLLSNPFYYLP